MTSAASRFISAVRVSWDCFEPWQATAEKGLADVDEDALRVLCEESGEEFETAEAEVLAYVRAKASAHHPAVWDGKQI